MKLKLIPLLLTLVLLGGLSFSPKGADAADPVPRRIMAIYDSQHEGDPRFTRTHRFLEMPLNYLGFRVDYHDIQKPLPVLDARYRGVVVWFTPDTQLKDPAPLINWLHGILDNQFKLLVMGALGEADSFRDNTDNFQIIAKLMRRIGVNDRNDWANLTHRAKIQTQNPEITNFERRYQGEIRPYAATSTHGTEARSHLQIYNPENAEYPYSDLVISHPNGGYIAEGYAIFEMLNEEGAEVLKQWFINPFKFLNLAFDASYLPKPDTTTLMGRRIFYSHLDGDGWNNLTEVEEYKGTRTLAAEVLYDRVFKPYRDFKFTVGVIVDELRVECQGLPDSLPVAKKILSLPNVEAGSHTFSHPLYWGFFAEGDLTAKEESYLEHYPPKPSQKFFLSEWILGKFKDSISIGQNYKPDTQLPKTQALRGIQNPDNPEMKIPEDYETPRSYACEPFNLDLEVRGSADYIKQIVPGKEVQVYQWSGSTTPFEAALRATRELGIPNINGGDSRFDSEYPSYASVAPLSVTVGDERQIYSSNSNENTYTNLWTGRFYGFRYLKETVDNTETPIRLDPFNVYFHTYSGQKQASLNAVIENLEYARTLNLIPIYTSHYAKIADSFFDTEFEVLGTDKWRVRHRGSLQTIRFDNASLKTIDWEKSIGVIGYKHLHGSLYASLDPGHEEITIALKPLKPFASNDPCEQPFVSDGTVLIKDLQLSKNLLTFATLDGEKGNITLQFCRPVEAIIQRIKDDKELTSTVNASNAHNQLQINLPPAEDALSVNVKYTYK